MLFKSVLLPAALLTSALFIAACSNNDNPTTVTTPATTRFTATLNGANEKPVSTTSPATGTFVGDLNSTTRVMSYTLTYAGFPANDPPMAGHLHRVTNANGTGPVDVKFPSPLPASPIIATTDALAQSKIDSMVAGKYYANMHTMMYPGGAIWGDLKKQ